MPRKPAYRGHAAAPEPTELQIHIAVVQHLRYRLRRGVLFWHTPNGEKRDKASAAKLKAMGTMPGVPDLMLLDRGRLYGLEIKRSSGRVSAEQKAMLGAFERSGAFTAVAYGLDAALDILESWGLLATPLARAA